MGFKDVVAGKHDVAAIEWMKRVGLTGGIDAEGTLFAPDRTLTRNEMASYLYRAARAGVFDPHRSSPSASAGADAGADAGRGDNPAGSTGEDVGRDHRESGAETSRDLRD